jgi:O-antigen/teichoic acid export membrane protein
VGKFFKISNPSEWIVKSGTTVFEQSVLSASNFIVGLLVGRWLSPELFGVYSIVYTIYLFLSGIQNSTILEPMSVLGPSIFRDDVQKYIKKNAELNRIFWLLIAALLSASALVFRSSNFELSRTLLGLAIASPFLFMFSLLRRRIYIALKPQLAVVISLAYSVAVLSGLFILNDSQNITPEIVFITIGGANLVAILVGLLIAPGLLRKDTSLDRDLATDEIALRNWRYGKWILAGSVVSWLVYLSNIPLIGILMDLEAAGIFRAVQNVTVPVDRILSGLSLLVVPVLSSKVVKTGIQDVRKLSLRLSLAAFGASVVFLIILSIFRVQVLEFVYGKQTYIDYAFLIPLIGTISVMNSISFGFINGLRATESSRQIFMAYLWGSIATFVFSIPGIYFFGLLGAVISQIGSIVLTTVILAWHWNMKTKSP